MATQTDTDTYKCPITNDYFRNPVHAADGHVYDYDALVSWFNTPENANAPRVTSPRTGLKMPKHIIRSFEYYTKYKEWCTANGVEPPIATTTFGIIASIPDVAPQRGVVEEANTHTTRRVFLRGCNDIPDQFFIIVPVGHLVEDIQSQYFYVDPQRESLSHRLSRCSVGLLKSLCSSFFATRKTLTLHKDSLVRFMVSIIKATVAEGRDHVRPTAGMSLSYRMLKYDTPPYTIKIYTTPLFALKLWHNNEPTFIANLFEKLTVTELLQVAKDNGCHPAHVSKSHLIAQLGAFFSPL